MHTVLEYIYDDKDKLYNGKKGRFERVGFGDRLYYQTFAKNREMEEQRKIKELQELWEGVRHGSNLPELLVNNDVDSNRQRKQRDPEVSFYEYNLGWKSTVEAKNDIKRQYKQEIEDAKKDLEYEICQGVIADHEPRTIHEIEEYTKKLYKNQKQRRPPRMNSGNFGNFCKLIFRLILLAFKPQISKKAKQLKREGKIEDRLIEEGRKIELLKIEKLLENTNIQIQEKKDLDANNSNLDDRELVRGHENVYERGQLFIANKKVEIENLKKKELLDKFKPKINPRSKNVKPRFQDINKNYLILEKSRKAEDCKARKEKEKNSLKIMIEKDREANPPTQKKKKKSKNKPPITPRNPKFNNFHARLIEKENKKKAWIQQQKEERDLNLQKSIQSKSFCNKTSKKILKKSKKYNQKSQLERREIYLDKKEENKAINYFKKMNEQQDSDKTIGYTPGYPDEEIALTILGTFDPRVHEVQEDNRVPRRNCDLFRGVEVTPIKLRANNIGVEGIGKGRGGQGSFPGEESAYTIRVLQDDDHEGGPHYQQGERSDNHPYQPGSSNQQNYDQGGLSPRLVIRLKNGDI